MGLDAPSTDLTARIQRKRAELLSQGLVEPARPGEQARFRGGAAQAPPPAPARTGSSRVVEMDETPSRGGAAALAETSATDGVGPEDAQTEEPGQAAEVTVDILPSDSVEPLVNEFGEAYDPNDDGGFDLGEYDGQQPEEFVPVKAEVKIAPAPPKAKIKRRSAADGIVTALAEIETLKALLGAIEFRLDNIEGWLSKGNVAQVEEMSALQRRFDELDASLLLIAEFLSKQAVEVPTEDWSLPDLGEPEIPSFVRPKRGRIARFFLGD